MSINGVRWFDDMAFPVGASFRLVPVEWNTEDQGHNPDEQLQASRLGGTGRLGDPSITWAAAPQEINTKDIMENARIVREEAIRLRCTHAWIMAPLHERGTVYTTTWKGEVEVPTQYDNRITVRFGRGPNHCNLHGHIYVNRAEITKTNQHGRQYKTFEYRLMEPRHRRHPRGGRCPACWAWGRYPPELIPPGSQDGVDDDKPVYIGM